MPREGHAVLQAGLICDSRRLFGLLARLRKAAQVRKRERQDRPGEGGHAGRLPESLVAKLLGDEGDVPLEGVDRRQMIAAGLVRDPEILSLIHISEPTRLLSISYAVFC